MTFNVCAELKIPKVFNDNMVLQRDIPVPIWGEANPNEKITVKFKGQEKSAIAGADGKWVIRLEPLSASAEASRLTVTDGKAQKEFNNVAVGEVWICSGQSNMQSSFDYLKITEEVEGADYPLIRLNNDGDKWAVCTAQNLKDFSCVAYYFGLNLWNELKIPVGLINISRGCSSIETWMTPCSLETNDSMVDGNGWNLLDEMEKFQRFHSNYDKCGDAEKERVFLEHCQSKYSFARNYLGKDGKPETDKHKDILFHMTLIKPAYLYNTLVAPIIPFGIRGAIWYQGETNADETGYAQKQQILIESCRKLWGQCDFPFYIVQVAPFKEYLKLPEFWLEQYDAVRKVSKSGIVSTVDIGDINECHPFNKRDVGKRLALLALQDTYGRKDIVASGPTYKSLKVDGSKVLVEFDHLGTGLTTKDGLPPNWFEVAGSDKKFVKAEATIQGDTVVFNSPMANPVYVRYSWNYIAEPNLRNQEGIPAFPFNTAEPFFQSVK